MTHPARRRAPSRSPSALRWLLLLALPLAPSACGDSSPTDGDPSDDDVTGLWTATITNQLTSESLTVYVRITETTVEVMQGLASACFDIDMLGIASRNGDTFTLQIAGSEPVTFTVSIARDGDQLRVRGLTGGNNTVVMDPSTATTSGLAECSLDGAWVGINNSDYLRIDGDLFDAYTPATETCRTAFFYTLDPRGGDRYFLQDRYADLFIVVEVQNLAGTLAVTFADGSTLTYEPTQEDPRALPICGGGDQEGIVCSELPALELGEAVDGALETSDARDADIGTYYDLYGLTLGARTEVQIDQSSGAIDTYLRLWTADGRFIAENDDADGTTFDSSLTVTLDAACYRVEASSWGADETGAYSIRVSG